MPREKGITIQRICPSCGNAFDVPPKRVKTAKYCSNACVGHANQGPYAERICEVCGSAFVVLASALRYGPGRYCSRQCSNQGQTQEVSERFWKFVDRSGGPDACWLWIGGDDGAGYGSFRIGRRVHRAHRVAFFLTRGRWPSKFLCHDCPGGDNPKCCNPCHMFEGDSAANNRDRAAKGRSAVGERHGKAITNEADVAEMRRRYDHEGTPIADLARDFGVTYIVVWRAVHRETWKHVD